MSKVIVVVVVILLIIVVVLLLFVAIVSVIGFSRSGSESPGVDTNSRVSSDGLLHPISDPSALLRVGPHSHQMWHSLIKILHTHT